MQTSLPSSTEAALLFVADDVKEDTLRNWMPGTETWQMCLNCDKHPHGQCWRTTPIIEEEENANSPSFPRSYSQPSTVSTISECCAPNFVYKRRKQRGTSITIFSPQPLVNTKRSADCLSVISSDAPSVAAKEEHVDFQVGHETRAVGAPITASLSCMKENCILKSQPINGCSAGKANVPDAALKNVGQRFLEVDSVNDSCSSSKSNVEPLSASMTTEVDDTGECSSSSAMVMEVKGKELSEKDLCISILRRQGMVGGSLPTNAPDSAEDAGASSGNSCSRTCKICGRTDTTLNMLICDHCEEAFHVSCFKPRMKKIPSDEWFCHSCLKKKQKIPNETATRKSPSIVNEMGRSRNPSAKDDSNLIALMLTDNEPYKTSVRVGKGFQAEVPDWSGPITKYVHLLSFKFSTS